MQLFSSDTTIFSKKKLNSFFAHENIKKQASKFAHNRPQTFFSQYFPAAQTNPELIFHIINMSQDSSVSLSVVISLSFKVSKPLPFPKISPISVPTFLTATETLCR